MNNFVNNRLHRSRSDRYIAGVCGGIAETYNVDVTLVRVLFALAGLTAGWGVILYLIMWFITPEA